MDKRTVAVGAAVLVLGGAAVYLYYRNQENERDTNKTDPTKSPKHKPSTTTESQERGREKEEESEDEEDSDDEDDSDDDEEDIKDVAKPEQLRRLISKTANGALVNRDRRLIVIEANSSIDQGLMMLHDNSITAIPVVDLATRSYLGFFSVLDVAAYMASLFPSSGDLPDELPDIPIKDLVNFSKSPYLEPQALSAPLDSLLPSFVEGIQRVLLKDDNDKVVNLVSQTDALRWLLSRMPKSTGSIRHSSAGLPIVGTLTGENFQKVNANAPLREALQFLARDGAVAIVDDDDVLVGDLSPTNLRTLSAYDLKRIYQPVSMIGDMKCVKVRPHATVDTAIRQLVAESKHRIWIIDGTGKPKKMVTIPYIIRKLIE